MIFDRIKQDGKSLREIEEAIPDISEITEYAEPIQMANKEDFKPLELDFEKRLSLEVDKISEHYQRLMQARFLEFGKNIEKLMDDAFCRVATALEESVEILSLYENNNSNIRKEDADNIYKLPNEEIKLGGLNCKNIPTFTAELVKEDNTAPYKQVSKWKFLMLLFFAFIFALAFFIPNDDSVESFSKNTIANSLKNNTTVDDTKKDATTSNSPPQVVDVEYVKKPYTRTFSEQTMEAVESVGVENDLNETIVIEKDDIDPSMLIDMPS